VGHFEGDSNGNGNGDGNGDGFDRMKCDRMHRMNTG